MKTIEILVVEDDAISACVFIKVLERNGYQVSHVQTGSDAMVLLKSDRYALAVMDFHLPDMNGFELAKKFEMRIG